MYKPKPLVPQPVEVQPFFFEQLKRHYDEHGDALSAAGAPSSSAAPSPSSSPSSSAGENDEWVPAPVTPDAAVNGILWTRFTPAELRRFVAETARAEQARTAALAAEVDDMWRRVEEVVERNARRADTVASAAHVRPWLDALHEQCLFWSSDDIIRRFQLDVAVDAADNTAAAAVGAASGASTEDRRLVADSRIELDFSVSRARRADAAPQDTAAAAGEPAPTQPPAHAAVPGKAKAYTAPVEDLMNPSRRPHCLRRLFAPILQRRAELPKSLTLFLDELQTVQSQELPALEAGVESKLMFTIPLHIPFQILATFINRHLVRPSAVAAMEERQIAAYRPAADALARLRQSVAAAAAQDTADMSHAQRGAAADDMYRQLFAELRERRALHAQGEAQLAAMEAAAGAADAELRAALEQCAGNSRAALARLEADAERVAAVMTAAGGRAVEVVREAEERFAADDARLTASVAARRERLGKSAAQQERLARRVREAVKELHAEQARYAQTAQELLQDELTLQQLRTSHEQLLSAVRERHAEAVQAETKAREIRELLAAAEVSRARLVSACGAHIDRLTHDDHFRQLHVLRYHARNAQEWGRAAVDVADLYRARCDAIASKASVSWQIEYLLAGEREWAAANAADAAPELAEAAAAWETVAARLEAAEMEVPAADAVSAAPEAVEARRQMRAVDDCRQAQRLVVTLRAYNYQADRADRADRGTQQQQQQQQALPSPQAAPSHGTAAGSAVSAVNALGAGRPKVAQTAPPGGSAAAGPPAAAASATFRE